MKSVKYRGEIFDLVDEFVHETSRMQTVDLLFAFKVEGSTVVTTLNVYYRFYKDDTKNSQIEVSSDVYTSAQLKALIRIAERREKVESPGQGVANTVATGEDRLA